jgi:hypothetical protein
MIYHTPSMNQATKKALPLQMALAILLVNLILIIKKIRNKYKKIIINSHQ